MIMETGGNVKQAKELLYDLKRKELRYNLHRMFLADYVKNRRIPRGYRIGLRSTLLNNDPIFVQRFFEILNKSSIDVMALTIERLSVHLNKLKIDITTAVNALESCTKDCEYIDIMEELDNSIEDEKLAISDKKKKKIQRDLEDYTLDRVYTWKNDRRQMRSRFPRSEGSDEELVHQGRVTSGASERPGSTREEFPQRRRFAQRQGGRIRMERGRGGGRGQQRHRVRRGHGGARGATYRQTASSDPMTDDSGAKYERVTPGSQTSRAIIGASTDPTETLPPREGYNTRNRPKVGVHG
ncbi:uncharacterized protein [Hyperolius riggenbachi]|uniref:uncharacterized protein n=1 Tax=Hyperolius riggenbachi TaxID=752182 RepID=UPI0035A38B42